MIQRFTFILAVTIIFGTSCLQAQTKTTFGFGMDAGILQGEFAEKLDATPVGFQFYFLKGTKLKGLSLGAQITHDVFGYRQWEADRLVNGSYESINYSFSTTVTDLSVALRVAPLDQGIFQPYAEAYAGPSRVYSGLSVVTEDENGCETRQDPQVFTRQWSYHYAVGGGVMINLSGDAEEAWFLDLGTTYKKGSTARFHFRNAETTYQTQMDVIRPHVGFLWRF